MSYADDGGMNGVPKGSISADGRFFKPGPNTVVKLNTDRALAAGSLQSVDAVAPAPAGATAFYTLKNVKDLGQSCGTNVIQQTSGRGKTIEHFRSTLRRVMLAGA
ncbi:hypothetical protein [Streptomyces sp. TRM49041]|uniref:hypothetical protein n=1 Tax=Streptomyces sp. TRM49041 TaxID=2603216 RepID=UPI0011EC5F3D|nr:hypothetical protein [Streptomyces sp. TRM49041]